RSPAVLAAVTEALRLVDASADGTAPLPRCHVALARPAGLRPGPAFERLALRAAPLLPRHGAAVLVSRHPALPQPAALVALDPDPVPAPRRPVEHRAVGAADLLRPCAVHVLHRGPAPVGALRPGGPVGGRPPHVGAGVRGVSPAAGRDRRPAASRR